MARRAGASQAPALHAAPRPIASEVNPGSPESTRVNPPKAGSLVRVIALFVVLMVTWVLLSGHFTAYHLGAGVACSALVTWLTVRMGLQDAVAWPVHLPRLPGLFAPLLRVLVFRTLFCWNSLIHDLTAVRAETHRRVGAAVI